MYIMALILQAVVDFRPHFPQSFTYLRSQRKRSISAELLTFAEPPLERKERAGICPGPLFIVSLESQTVGLGSGACAGPFLRLANRAVDEPGVRGLIVGGIHAVFFGGPGRQSQVDGLRVVQALIFGAARS